MKPGTLAQRLKPSAATLRSKGAQMRGWATVLAGVVVSAALAAPEAVIRGVLVETDPGPVGDLCVRVQDHHVYCYRFDAATAFERGGMQAGLMDLRPGDTVEVTPSPGPNPRLPRATLVRVILEPPAAPRRRIAPRTDQSNTGFDDLFPRGDLSFSGVVTRLTSERLLLATRSPGGLTEILLRQDTRFVHDGRPVAASALMPQARVFIRAARNLDGAIEAYQVMWGGILRTP
jgi:hypothetical protein